MSEQQGEYKTKAKDKSNEHLYFTVTPRLVWALADDPYEYTFWCVIKDIAGEDGECILSRDDMATLTMMSGGKASECRDNLIAKKLLEGECRRDPGYPQAVWHLSIPDFWEANVRWAKKYISLRDRINFKREQKEARKPSPGERPSPGDERPAPSDQRTSPDDLKKNVLKNQKEEIKNTCLSILQSFGYSVFGNDMSIWWNFRHRLECDDVSITGDGKKMVISGLNEKPKDGPFTLAEIWQDRIAPSYAKYGLELEFLA